MTVYGAVIYLSYAMIGQSDLEVQDLVKSQLQFITTWVLCFIVLAIIYISYGKHFTH